MLRMSSVVERVGVHAVTLYRWERAGRFPQRVRLGPNSVAWREDEINQWLNDRTRANADGVTEEMP